jgi:hypothetical protein
MQTVLRRKSRDFVCTRTWQSLNLSTLFSGSCVLNGCYSTVSHFEDVIFWFLCSEWALLNSRPIWTRYWLAQNNVSEWGDMYIRGLLFKWTSLSFVNLWILVTSLISSKLYSSWTFIFHNVNWNTHLIINSFLNIFADYIACLC